MAEPDIHLLDLPPADEVFVFPASFAQRRLWFLEQLEPGGSAYHIAAAVHLAGRLDREALAASLREIVRRHEALRTTFGREDGEPVQIVAPQADLELPVDDLRECRGEARHLAAEEARRPFDLERGPLLRARLLRLAEEEHVLLLTLHHIVADGWSMGVLVRETAALYAAFSRGQESPLPELPVQYADFTIWQQDWLQGETLDRLLAGESGRLRGLSPLELPADRPRPPRKGENGGSVPARLEPGLAAALQAFGRGERATLFMTLLAGFQALLGRLSGQDDVAVGSPVANRNRPELEGLIGFFVNTLVLRTGLEGDPGFRKLLGRAREGVAAAYAHQELPFELLVGELAPERSLSRTPLFQVMLALQNAPMAPLELAGLSLRLLPPEETAPQVDLSLDLEEAAAGGLDGRWSFDADLFDATTVHRFDGHFRTLLAAALADPARPVADLPLLAPAEEHQLRVEWNDTAVAGPVPRESLHGLIEAWAARTPEAVAVVFADGGSLTYGELGARAGHLARRLVRLGVGRESRVGVFCERSLDLPVALLGILKAGGAFVPVDPSAPAERIASLLEDAAPQAVLVQSHLLDLLPAAWRERSLLLDGSLQAEDPGEAPLPEVLPEQAAYVIYTSGSTGKPKGVVVAHRAIRNRLAALQGALGQGPEDRILQLASIGFDTSVYELFALLAAGGGVVLVRPGGHQEPAELVELIAREGVTEVNLVPSLLRVLLDEPGLARCASLRRILCGGEALPPDLRDRVLTSLRASLVNFYGPTETAIDATWWRFSPAEAGSGTVPIGRPLPNLSVWIVDRGLRPLPAGAPGELLIGGVALARGYLDRPGETAERFVPDPFSGTPGGRLYRTGDLARWRTDGAVDFLGRIDHQVKIRGVRVEPGEIEAALAAHPDVREAVVLAREEGERGTSLVGYVVPSGTRPFRSGELRAWLGQRLPAALVPSALIAVDEIPLTPNGKVDRKALERLAPERTETADGRAPRDPVADVAAAVWAEVLGVERVGVHDHFFELGGHSLLATRVISRMRMALGVELPVATLFEAPTLEAFAMRAAAARRAEGALPPAPPLVPVPRDGNLPLSFAQQRLWFLDRLAPDLPLYNMAGALRLVGRLDAAALAAAFAALVERHEALRTTFPQVAGRPVQRIASGERVPLPLADLAGIPAGARRTELERITREEARRPFALDRGPLLRAGLVRLTADEHVLSLTLHHIVADGWSMDVLQRELAALYTAFCQGSVPALPPLPVQYADFAVWQRRWLAGEALEAQLDYWRRQLAGAPPVLELPADSPALEGEAAPGSLRSVVWPEELAARLRALSRREGASLAMTWLAAFQAVLSRWTGEEDFLVGSPIANRNRPEVEGLIGFFVNTLALRADLSRAPSFRELLGRARATSLAAYDHQDLPFDQLVEELAPERSRGRSPLVQVMLGFEAAPRAALEVPGLTLEPLGEAAVDPGTSKLDLSLQVHDPGTGEMRGVVEHAAHFEPPTVLRLLSHLENLLRSAAEAPDTPVSALPLLAPAERHQLLAEWNDTAGEEAPRPLLHELVFAQAARTPEAPAVELEGESWTYRELAVRARGLASHLRRMGVGPDVVVGLHAQRSLALVVGALGILEAGAAWLPLDPDFPGERLAFQMEDAGARLLVAQAGLDLSWRTGAEEVVLLGDAPVGAEERQGSLSAPDNLAYVLYTSGSTGRPKGVMVSHRGIVNRLLWAQRVYALGTDDAVLQKASIGFDFSVWEIFAPLLAGARLVLARPGGQRDARYLANLIAARGVTFVHFVPSQLGAFLEAEAERPCPSLRQIFSGGEALTPELRDRHLAGPGRRGTPLDNQYGPTEISIDTTRWTCAPGQDPRRVPIGHPIANTRIHLVDRGLEAVPLGAAGELLVGGEGVARGYLGRPGLTAERFVPDPFSGTSGGRLYRTGDLARRLPDGTLELRGRIDDQIKIRGVRVEPGEVEAVLAELPEVAEAVVGARDEGGGELRLVAWVVPRTAPLDPGELRRTLRGRLPEAMIPSVWMELAELPRTPNGKVDRRALLRLESPGREGGAYQEDAPRDPVEEILAALWAEVLGLERVGAHQGFFDLGGHSLLATQAISRIRGALGVELPLAALFEDPTPAGLARRVRAARQADLPAAPPIVPVPRERALPLSFAQQRLWFLDRLVPDNAFYNMAGALRLSGRLDPAALAAALGEIVRRHEALRTTFRAGAAGPEQVIAPPGPVPLTLIDLASLPEGMRDPELARLTREEAQRPFDLSRGPLLRAALLRRGSENPGEHVLALTVHHIVSDGWSMGVLEREVAALYAAFAERRFSPLPELPVQYADFAVWQRHRLAGGALDGLLAWWREQLAGAPEVLDLPLDHPRVPGQVPRGGMVSVQWPAGLSAAVRSLGRRAGATTAMTVLAGFAGLLARLSGQRDLLLGAAVANRNRAEIEDLIGFFVNTLVLRADLSGAPTFRELIGRMRDVSLAAYDHQDLPFERLVEEVDPERSLGRNPLVQVMFGFQNFPRTAPAIPGLTVTPLDESAADTGTSKFDLTLFLVESGEEIHAFLEFASDLFEAVTARRLLDRLERLLRNAVETPGLRFEEIAWLASEERHQLVHEWNDSASAYPAGESLGALFEAMVRRAPDAPAAIFDEGTLTYRELDRRANRLAHRLRALGVGPESRVGLCLERSLGLVVGMVGIVKAGGAYVPLDPAYPAERLAFMAADAGLAALVTEERLERRLAGQNLPSVLLNDIQESGDEEPLPPTMATDGASLAYVIYTSGSTGTPKGVEILHRSVARLVLETDYVQLGPADRVGQAANASFDAITFEVWAPLLTGGAVVGIPKEVALAPAELGERIRRLGITTLFVTTALFDRVALEDPAALEPLRHLFFGGEAVDPRRVRTVLQAAPPRRLLHVYGPTESTTFASWHLVDEVEEGAATVPIGRPLANTRLYVVDPAGEPTPAGAAGELMIGGDGLARSYLGRPALTAERFVPDPFGPEPGGRLYRTGDLVRQRGDGAVEFVGRIDQQVKLRGFRIEPGEIEALLDGHPAVRQSVVAVREDAPGDRRLVAYVVRDPGFAAAGAGAETEQVSQWGEIFDDVYREERDAGDPTFDIVGWDSTFTGTPIPREEMREWLEDTIDRILSLEPRRVLEIGCGTGMLLFRIAPGCEVYLGTDVSRRVLASLEARIAGRLPQVRLLHRGAERFDGVEPGSFDTVILNSVAQYFPSADYLAEVLEKAAWAVRPGGAIFLGDLRSLPLLETFHTAVESFQEPGLSTERLLQRVRARALEENELAVAPAFFAALRERVPAIGRVEIHPKRGRAHNELTGYRYQVVLRIGAEVPPVEVPWSDGREETLESLRARLAQGTPLFGLQDLPNARVVEGPALEPQDVWDLGEAAGFEVELGWARHGADGRFDALFRRRDLPSAVPLAALLPAPELPASLEDVANDPLRGRFVQKVVPELRSRLAERLPEHMLPSAFVVLDTLPLTPNGKVDRRALPAPDPARSEAAAAFAPPRTLVERELADIWAALLAVGRVGIEDDFFGLGGHSLLATQAVSRIRERLGVDVPLRALFESPTIAGLAEQVEILLAQGVAAQAPPVVPVPRGGDLPLSFAQERLWFLDRFAPRTLAYNESSALRLTGRLDVAALRSAIGEIVRRHEALRTRFPETGGRAVQRIEPPFLPDLPVVDLAGLGGEAAEAETRRLALEKVRRPFDLARGPLLRTLLVRQTTEEAAEEHALLFTVHHIVFDGWSAGVLARELSALAAGETLPELPVQYADFAVWQRRWLQGEVLERQLAWWRERLAGVPVLELPADRPRPAVPSHRGGWSVQRFEPELATGLRALAQKRDATLYMVLLAAFQALLHRHTGQEDLAVGSPIANRNRGETEGLIGFFVNTLVLRGHPAAETRFADLLTEARTMALGAYAHQDLPFERLVEELRVERSLQHNPLFQTVLALQNAPDGELRLPGLTLAPIDLDPEIAKFDLSLSLVEEEGGITARWEHSADLFDPSTVARLAERFRLLLQGIAANPDLPMADLPLIPQAERRQVLEEWNATATPWPAEASLQSLFEERVRHAPDAPAVVFGEAGLSYGELSRRANRLAWRLRSLGVGPESRVGLCLERSADLIAGILGIVKAGGAYVPLDPDHPRERLAFMVADAGVEVLVSDERGEEALGGLVPRTVRLGALVGEREDDPPVWTDGGSLAYVIYTSGSTGTPKGVGVVHRAVSRLVLETGYVVFRPDDRVAQTANASFDAITFEVWGALLHGGCLVGIPTEVALAPAVLEAELRERGVTVLFLTTSLFHQIARERPGALTGLRYVVAGGEALDPRRAAEVLAAAPPRALVNGYGPTESTTFAVTHQVDNVPVGAAAVPIGRPIANTRAYLLDRRGLPVPLGSSGELLLGGAGLARGYLGRPALTAECFVPDPFGPPGDRLYRTGDLARQRPGGTIEYLGRIDQQVKVRGFRIEPGEIEAALARHPAVAAAVVTAPEDAAGVRRLVAYVVPRPEIPWPAPAELRAWLGETLPDYMLPAAWVTLPELPLTPNGKLDRRALPAPDGEHAGAPFAPPRNPTEELLAGIWSDLLEGGPVGIDDDFFEAGGHSLLATRVVARVRETFGVEVPLRTLFEAPTVAGLATEVERAVRARSVLSMPPLVREPRSEAPLSFSQQRLWFLDRWQPGAAVYNVPCPVRLTGPLSVPDLAAALSEIVRRHEALRTTFAEVDGEPRQVIHPAVAVPLPVIDLGALPAATAEAEILALAREEAREPFDLECGPLARGRLVRRAADDHALLWTMHHIISDGWSVGVLLRELATLFAGAPLPELPVQYADFAVWQRRWLAGEVLEGQLPRWEEALSGIAALELPTDRPRPPVRRQRGRTLDFHLDPALAAGVSALGRRAGATLFMTLATGFFALLARLSGQNDVALGTPVAGRRWREVEDLIGFFINTLVLRVDLAGEPDVLGLLARVREVTLEAYAHQDVPFELLVERLETRRDPSRTPLFQVLFLLQNTPSGPLELPGLTLAPFSADTGTAQADLLLSMQKEGGALAGVLQFDSDLFDEATARRLLEHFRTLLAGMVAAPRRSLEALPLLTDAERVQLLLEWNDTRTEYPLDFCLHEMIARRIAQTPEAVAVTFEGEALTCAALDAWSGQVARRLRERGAGPESLVAVVCDRSLDLVPALLGVLRAGAAYVPIDPSYPADRIVYMLEDSQRGAAPLVLAPERLRCAVPEPWRDAVLPVDFDPLQGGLEERVPADPDNPVYVLYTSGSTGRPKGAVNTHRALVNRLLWMQETFRLEPDDRVVQKTPISFDVSVWEVFWPLLTGARIVMARPDGHRDPRYLADLIAREGVTTIHFVASMLRVFLEELEEADLRRCASLRRVVQSGEAVTPDLRDLCRARLGRDIWNLYGPTEAAIDVTAWNTAVELPGGGVPIGRPIANLVVHVVDRTGAPSPVGVHGELLLGGVGLARGYVGRPDLTADRFVPDPFAESPGARVYRTGDLTRRLPGGEVEYLGRLDDQVKLRGVRIEPAEIDQALRHLPGIRDAVTLARRDGGDLYLAAYLVVEAGAELKASGVRAALRARLPEALIPSAVVFLDALPLNPSGKGDRRALPVPQRGEEAATAAPRTPVEEVLTGLWARLLELPEAGIHDDFFERGGHSLLATRLTARLREAFGVEVPLPTVFAAPTPARLAVHVEAALREGRGAEGPPIRRAAPPYPLSFAQQRLWFLDRLRPGGVAWSMPAAVHAAGRLAPVALAAALAEVVRRHEALRTRFETGPDGQPLQRVDPPPAPAAVLPEIDLGGLPPQRAGDEARRLADEDARRPFDLERGPLARFALARLGGDEHLLLVNTHHTVSDGWSLALLVREAVTLYSAFLKGRPSPLPALPVQYGDYAIWQREWLQGEVLERQLAWWRERLGGELPVLNLPGDPWPGDPESGGVTRRASLRIEPERLAGLRGLARHSGATLFMVLVAAVQLLLRRLSGERDVIVGSPVAGRPRPELEGVIGLFLNNLALRTDLSGDPTGRELIARVREVTLGAYSHQDLPFERLVEEIRPERDLDRNPVFDVLVNLLNTPRETLAAPGIVFSSEGAAEPEAKFALNLSAVEEDGGLRIDLMCDPARFGAADGARMLEQLDLLLAGLAAMPEAPVSGHSLLTPACRAVLPDPTEPLPDPGYAPVTALFYSWAERTPEAVALVQGERGFTYGELARAAGFLARGLREQGLAPGEVVAVRGGRSPGLIAAIAAVLASGGVLLLLDPDLPEQRHRQMIEMAGAQFFLDAPPVDPATGRLPGGGEPAPLPVPDPDSAAYLFFTSGSTGVPKGVLGRHKGLSHFVAWERERFAIGTGDRCAQIAAPAVDVILRESFLALTSGATLCLPPAGEGGLGDLIGWCEAERISVLHTVPTLARTWLAAAPAGASLSALRWLFLVGEPLPDGLVRQWRERFPGSGVVNLYGSTETNLAKSFYVIPDPPRPGVQPAGWPMPQCQLLVFGEGGHLCAVGEMGEIAVRTPFLSLGYLGRPDETALRFTPHSGGERINRTGDLGRFRPDGAVEVAGRADGQVKIRGVRIEPDEVAAVLAEHPAVAACAVLARADEQAGKRLVAYAVPRDAGLRAGDLLAHAARRLPAVMVPSAVVFIEALPLTATGKLDRRALLRHAEPAGPEAAEAAAAPRTPVEELVAGIWAEVLGRETVGRDDNFFSLGGHSLLATQVVSRLRQVFHVEIPLRRFFEAPTVAGLAAEVAAGRTAPPAAPLAARRRSPDEPRPLSFAQERIWLLDQLAPAAAYNIPIALRLRGSLDLAALAGAFSRILRRHEVLRAVFPASAGLPVQRIAPAVPVRLRVADLSVLPEGVREAELARLAREEARRPFDLARGPLWRLTVARLGASDHALLLTQHHIVADGWSRGVLTRELSVLYRAAVAGEPAELPELPVQYADFAAWEREQLQGEALESRLAFWRSTLAGAPASIPLPFDGGGPSRGEILRRRLPGELAAAVAALGRSRGATPFMVLLAAFELLLWRWSGQEDLVVGTVIANRPRVETEGLAGCFINFLPLRVRVPAMGRVAVLIERVRDAVLDAWAWQDCPFEKLVEAVRPERRGGASPLYNVGFLLQSFPAAPFAAGLSAEILPVDNGAALLDLRLVAVEDPEGGLELAWEHDRARFQPETIELLADGYLQILTRLVEEPEAPLTGFELPAGLIPTPRRPRLLVAATFTADPALKPLRFWLDRLGMETDVELAPYHQVFQQLLDPASPAAANQGGVNALLIRVEDWTPFRDAGASAGLRSDAERAVDDFAAALEQAADRGGSPWLVLFCPPSPAFAEAVGSAFLEKMEDRIAALAERLPGVYVSPGRERAELYPVADPHDPHADRLGHVPYQATFFTALATLLVRKLHALRRPPSKVVVVDADGTLWDGVCGEDGPLGVRIDPPRRAVQELLVRLHDAGFLICVCSKNEEADVAAVFDRHPDMLLRREHVAAWRVDWQPKSTHLRSLAAELGLGLDSFVFLDDNPVEIAEVQAHCPGVVALQLPAEPARIPQFLRHVWAFDRLKVTTEDRGRTALYREQRERDELRRSAASLEEFLAGLQLEVDVRPLTPERFPEELPRVAQLIQRTNQFNLTLVRRGEAEVRRFLAEGGEGLTVAVRDRFGDYGLVGVVLFTAGPDSLAVETLLLSCRVLGRGVERRVLARLGTMARERRLARIDLPWMPGERNRPALDFLTSVAADFQEPAGEGLLFRVLVDAAVSDAVSEEEP